MKAPSEADRPASCMRMRHADDGQQRRRRHRLLDARQGDEAQQIVEHEVTDDDDHRDEAEALEHRDDVHARG